jgi:hypothetical protein
MKLSVALGLLVATIALLSSSEGFSQQATEGGTTTSVTRAPNQPAAPALAQSGTTTIRVIGSPSIQPAPGLGIECTPVEQDVVGFIIGPSNLCDR